MAAGWILPVIGGDLPAGTVPAPSYRTKRISLRQPRDEVYPGVSSSRTLLAGGTNATAVAKSQNRVVFFLLTKNHRETQRSAGKKNTRKGGKNKQDGNEFFHDFGSLFEKDEKILPLYYRLFLL